MQACSPVASQSTGIRWRWRKTSPCRSRLGLKMFPVPSESEYETVSTFNGNVRDVVPFSFRLCHDRSRRSREHSPQTGSENEKIRRKEQGGSRSPRADVERIFLEGRRPLRSVDRQCDGLRRARIGGRRRAPLSECYSPAPPLPRPALPGVRVPFRLANSVV